MTPQDQWGLQKERVLAWSRVVFALVAICVIQLNPSRAAKFSLLSPLSLGSFLAYSLVVLYVVRRKQLVSAKIGLATTCFDLVWISLIVFSTGGTRTPFFTYYLFPVITASSRWGIKGSVAVALIGDALYCIVRYTLAAEALESPLGIDTFIVRSIYLVFLACFFGFLSEFENKQNQKLLALSQTAGEVATLLERRRIMQDLHDGLLQSLATHILRVETCRKHLLEAPKELDRELRSLEDDVRSSMKEIRQFLRGKETQSVMPGMLFDKLKEDLRFLRDGLGLRVTLETVPEDLNVPEAMEQDLYYVLREGLTNITRHAQASRADIVLTQTDGEIRGMLRDDGVGFDLAQTENSHGLGLRSMKERISRTGGKLELQSSPGQGTNISFVLPVAARAAA